MFEKIQNVLGIENVRAWLQIVTLLSVLTVALIIVFAVVSGRQFTGIIGGNEISISAINEIQNTQETHKTKLEELEIRVNHLSENLSVQAIWDEERIAHEHEWFQASAENLLGLVAPYGGTAVTIWVIEQEPDTCGRFYIAQTPKKFEEYIKIKAAVGWCDNDWHLKVVQRGLNLGVVNNVPGINNQSMSGIADVRYEVIDGTPELSTNEGVARKNWMPELGNMVTFTPGMANVRTMVYIAIDYEDINTVEDARMAMWASLTFARPTAVKCVDKLVKEINPDILKLKWFWQLSRR